MIVLVSVDERVAAALMLGAISPHLRPHRVASHAVHRSGCGFDRCLARAARMKKFTRMIVVKAVQAVQAATVAASVC